MYLAEADGLRFLSVAGGPSIPVVLSVDEDHLLIEDFGQQKEQPSEFWREFGRRLATLHLVKGDRFGYSRDNYLGTMRLKNDWHQDGRTFFAETRMLCFLGWPKSEEVLTAEDRKAVERLAHRLPELIPEQGPSKTHGDLWSGNIIHDQAGNPALIDPAVYYGMPEADLALLPLFGNLPGCLFEGYQEVRPLETGWRERLEILAIRDALCMLAEYGDLHGAYARMRSVVDRFA